MLLFEKMWNDVVRVVESRRGEKKVTLVKKKNENENEGVSVCLKVSYF